VTVAEDPDLDMIDRLLHEVLGLEQQS